MLWHCFGLCRVLFNLAVQSSNKLVKSISMKCALLQNSGMAVCSATYICKVCFRLHQVYFLSQHFLLWLTLTGVLNPIRPHLSYGSVGLKVRCNCDTYGQLNSWTCRLGGYA